MLFAPTGGASVNASAEQLEEALQSVVGDEPKMKLADFAKQSSLKIDAEIASGAHAIVVVSEQQFTLLAKAGGLTPLEDVFDPAEYPEG